MRSIMLWGVMFALFFTLGATSANAQGVSVGVSIGLPPPVEFAEPPDVVVVPSGNTYVYMVPDQEGFYFLGGFWYRFYEGNWFRATAYGGPWIHLYRNRVPLAIVNVPPGYYHHLPPGYYRVHYNDLHTHWRDWDHQRHWHRYDWYNHEVRAHHDRRRLERDQRPHVDRGPHIDRGPRGDSKPHGDRNKHD